MKLTIVYDNELYIKDIGLKSDWGFACLIDAEDEFILFDTGAKGKIFLNNMEKLRIDPCVINKIVISHEHWDHDGGLKTLMPIVGDVELYRLEKERSSENMSISIVEKPQEIIKGIYTTGRLKGTPIDEQSLILKSKKGWCVLTGCSHPGVEENFNAAKQYGNITGLVGGLHSFNNFSILEDLDFICPCHCTKHKRMIKELFPRTYIEGGVGKIIEI